MPESLMAAIVPGSSSRAVSASFESDMAALRIAYIEFIEDLDFQFMTYNKHCGVVSWSELSS